MWHNLESPGKSLNEGLFRSRWPASSMGDFLDCGNQSGKIQPAVGSTSLGRSVLHFLRAEQKGLRHKQACKRACMHFSLLLTVGKKWLLLWLPHSNGLQLRTAIKMNPFSAQLLCARLLLLLLSKWQNESRTGAYVVRTWWNKSWQHDNAKRAGGRTCAGTEWEEQWTGRLTTWMLKVKLGFCRYEGKERSLG